MNQTLIVVLIGVATGIAIGGVYTLMAMGYNLVLAATGVFNFAQGAILMGATILAFLLSERLGWPAPAVVTVVAVGGAAAGLAIELVAVRPVEKEDVDLSEAAVITTLGLGLMATSIAGVVFGVIPQPVSSYVSTRPLHLGQVPIRPIYVVMFVVAVGITILVDWVLRRTPIGHVLRATLQDPEGAALLGFDTRLIVRSVFALAGFISALAGYLIAPITQASPYVADELGLFGFAALAIGGFGSFGGALVGGLLVGLITGIGAGFIDPHLLRPLVFLLCVVFLLVRPGGVFGSKGLFGSARLRDV